MKNKLPGVAAAGFMILAFFYLSQKETKKAPDVSRLPGEEKVKPLPKIASEEQIRTAYPVVEKKTPEYVTGFLPSPDELSDEDRRMILEEHPKALEMMIFGENATLRKFKHLSEKKVLLSGDEQAELVLMLRDEALVADTASVLSSPMTQENFLKEQMERMFYIDYLRAGLEDKNNPAGEQIRSGIRSVILADNLYRELPLKVRKSIAAEKAELIALLASHDPRSLSLLRERAQGSRHQKLLNHYLSPGEPAP